MEADTHQLADAHVASTSAPTDTADAGAATSPAEVLDDLLIEEISIDGMCGVY